jgi:hypothetical protein
MSLIHTESFFAFGKYNGSDAFDPAVGGGAAARAAYKANLMRAGYDFLGASNATADTSGGFVVRDDPVYPTRAALVHSSDAAAGVNVGLSAAIKKRIPITEKQIIVGFSLFVPADYVPNVNNSTVPVFRMQGTANADTTWATAVIAPISSAKEAFRICNDLSIRWGTDAAQSSRKLKVGVMNYMEVRISPNEVSVWIDDTFVMQKVVSLTAEVLAWIFENNANAGAGGTNMSGTPGRWAMGNMYILYADGVAPYQRLGPTTRVIGSRPDTDVDVRFIRPVGAPTNASVAAQDLVDSPPSQLQSTTVGDFDTYSSAQNAADIQTMGMVHAVATKVLAQNLEPDVHTVRPYLKYANSGEGVDTKVRELVLLSGLPFTRTIRAMGIRKSDNSVWVVGEAESIWRSGANQDISVWTKLRDTGSAVIYDYMLMCDDGSVILSRSDNKTDWVTPGSDIINLGLVAFNNNPGPFVFAPDGSRYVSFLEYTTTNSTAYTANPFVTSPAWTIVNMTAATSGPVGNGYGAALKVGTLVVALVKAATGIVTVGSGAMSAVANFVSRDTGDATFPWTALTHDGTAWLIGGTSNDSAIGGSPRIRRSPDTVTWSPVSATGSMIPGGNQYLRCAASNVNTQQSIFAGDAGAVVMSPDGMNWRQLPRLTTQPLNAAVCLANGDFLLAGGAGVMLQFKSQGKDVPLLPLAGYSMAFSSAVFNPSTAAPWTPAEAAGAKFGVRLTT